MDNFSYEIDCVNDSNVVNYFIWIILIILLWVPCSAQREYIDVDNLAKLPVWSEFVGTPPPIPLVGHHAIGKQFKSITFLRKLCIFFCKKEKKTKLKEKRSNKNRYFLGNRKISKSRI